MGYGRRCRIGLLVPSSNTTMEAELTEMIPDGVSIHSARMNLEEVTLERLIEMAEDAKKAALLLATAGVDVIVYGCTSGSLVGGTDWEEILVQRIEQATGVTTLSTSRAVTDALTTLKARRIAVATPYTEDLNHLEQSFLESQGFELTAIRGLGLIKNLDIGKTEEAIVEQLVEEVADGSDTVFISCTNLPTMGLIEKLETKFQRPVITSNQASLWAALRNRGIEGIEGYGILLKCHL